MEYGDTNQSEVLTLAIPGSLAAASLIGFETLAVLVGYATIWPVGIPFMLVAIGVYAVIRRRLRKNKDDEDAVG